MNRTKLTLILVLVGVVVLFTLQNTQVVDVRLLFWKLSMSQGIADLPAIGRRSDIGVGGEQRFPASRAALKPFLAFEVQQHPADHGDDDQPRSEIAVTPMQFRHIDEIHSVHAY